MIIAEEYFSLRNMESRLKTCANEELQMHILKLIRTEQQEFINRCQALKPLPRTLHFWTVRLINIDTYRYETRYYRGLKRRIIMWIVRFFVRQMSSRSSATVRRTLKNRWAQTRQGRCKTLSRTTRIRIRAFKEADGCDVAHWRNE